MDYNEFDELVNTQIAYHERSAKKARTRNGNGSVDFHLKAAERWREASQLLGHLLKGANHNEDSTAPAQQHDSITIRPSDLDGLPDELLSELGIDKDDLELKIQRTIEDAGGIMSLDKLMISLYRETGEVYKRRQLTQKLYRMIGKKTLFSVPNRKAVYSTQPQEGADYHGDVEDLL